MPVYTIQGPQGEEYDIEAPEGASKEAAFEFFKREHSAGRVKPKQSKLLDNPITGIGETALGMLSGGLAQPLAGLAGIASGMDVGVVRDVQEALTYKPRGATGKRYTENTGEILSKPIEWAGKGAYSLTGSEAARSISEAGTEFGLNFLPLPILGKGAKKLSKAKVDVPPIKDIKSVAADIDAAKNPPPAPTPDVLYTDTAGNTRGALPDAGELAARQQQAQAAAQRYSGQMELPLETSAQAISEMQNRNSGQMDMFAADNAPQNLALKSEAARQAEAQYTQSVDQLGRMNEDPYAQGHLDFNDFGNNDPMAHMPEMRVDENGMPIRADLSMEAQNLENPLQMNMWGDELGPALDQTRSLTDAIDSMPAGADRQRGIDMLSQDVKADFTLPEKPSSGGGSPLLTPERPTTTFGPRSQRGGQIRLTDLGLAAVAGFKKIASLTKSSPDVAAAKSAAMASAKQERVKSILGNTSGYLENVTTPEAVIALADTSKDISGMASAGGRTIAPGINHLAIKTSNPLIKYVRAKTRDVFVVADRLTEQYITGVDGIGKTVQELKPAELTEVVQLLQLGDKKQFKITPELMDKHGFSEMQKRFVEQYYDMDQKKLEVWNKGREEAGKPIVPPREGHVPGMFKGDYKQLVLSPDGKPLGVIAVDFKWQLEAARKAMMEKFPQAKFSPMRRSSMGASSGRTGEFGAMQEVLTMLAEKDPAFKEVQDLIASAIADNSDKAYGAAQHALRKKGIVGNEGNKPWLSPEQNAKDFVKAYLTHWEDQMISHLALPVEQNVRALMENPALDHMDNAKTYVDSYLKNMGGRGAGDFGKSLNTVIDTPSRLAGIGPSGTRAVVGQFNKRLGQYAMGFGNYLFSITQWLQVAQTGIPELTAAANQLGVEQTKVAPAMMKALKEWTTASMKEPSPEFKVALEEGRARGLMTFSEFSDVSKITQNKYSKMYDKVVDYNRAELGEKPTRPLVFLTAVNMLKDSGLQGKALYDAAYNITQAGMFDYRMNERPMMYQRMGVAGQLVGGLQTFKHAYLGQLLRLAKNSGNDPMSASLAGLAILGYAGVTGVPFYSELDTMFQALSEKMGKRYTIAEYAMAELPRWLKSGVISDITNVNMQSRLSAADVLPNSLPETISPYMSTVGRIGDAVGDVASFNDGLAWSNLGTQLTPQGPLKGLAEKALTTDDEGYVLNREGLRGNKRTEWDKGVRTYSGGRSLDEALTGENQYNSGQRLKGYKDRQSSVLERVKREFVQGTLTQEGMKEYATKYKDAKGDPAQMVNSLIEYAKTTKLDKQKRLQGVPSGSLSSIYRYAEYADDVEQ